MKRLFTLLLISFAALSCEMIDEKLDDFLGRDDSSVTTIANKQIWYTSTDGEIVEPYSGVANNYADALTTFGANIVSNTYDAAKKCWVIKFDGKVTTIGREAFFDCGSLTSVTIPDSVTTIGYMAFCDCSSLTSVTIGNSVTTIGQWAFADCSSLTSVTIPDGVTEIEREAFSDCSSLQEFKGKFASEDGRCLIIDGVLNYFAPAGLTEYTIPNSVTTIKRAFSRCSSLTSITIPDSVTTIGDEAFFDCSSLTSVTIPDSVTTIGSGAFAWCRSLTSVTIPDSVTSIGVSAFYECSSLTSVTIGDSVTSIGEYAFFYCSSLTSVTIPDSVTTIEEGAFWGCSSLTSVYCKATTPPAGGSRKFYNNASGRKIYVPMESVEAYKSAEGWSDYASDIVGYNF